MVNKYALAVIAFVAGRYIGRKDDEGRGKPSVLDFAAAMTPEPDPSAEIPYKLPSLLRWPKWLRPPPGDGAGSSPITLPTKVNSAMSGSEESSLA